MDVCDSCNRILLYQNRIGEFNERSRQRQKKMMMVFVTVTVSGAWRKCYFIGFVRGRKHIKKATVGSCQHFLLMPKLSLRKQM